MEALSNIIDTSRLLWSGSTKWRTAEGVPCEALVDQLRTWGRLMPTLTLNLPEILVDRDLIERSIREYITANEDARESWPHLVDGEWDAEVDPGEFIEDLLALARVVPGVFGGVEIHGHVLREEHSGDSVVLAVQLPGRSDPRGHERWRLPTLSHTDYFYTAELTVERVHRTGMEAAVAGLERIGLEAAGMIERLMRA
jgi:hypothetical protein